MATDTADKINNNSLFGVLSIVIALLIIVSIFGGAAFFAIKKNYGGFADKYRQKISTIPILKLALPELPDPYDPKNLTTNQILKKYDELRKQKSMFENQFKEYQSQIAAFKKQLEEQNAQIAKVESLKEENKKNVADIQKQKAAIEVERQKFMEVAANNDIKGFKEFYEKMDKEQASTIYEKIMKTQKISQERAKFVKIYEGMDSASAAKIFEGMGKTQIPLIVEALKDMKQESSSAIIQEMDVTFAALVTQKLSALYTGQVTKTATNN